MYIYHNMASFVDSSLNGAYLSNINHTFFDAVVNLDQLLNYHYNDNDKNKDILARIHKLSYIQDHLYHSDEYSNMSFIELEAAVNQLMTPEEKVQTIQLFDNSFGYESTTVEEEEAFQKIILRLCIYSKSFANEPKPEIRFRSDWTDDFYEWFIYNKLANAPLEDRCVGMHDAWALALMYGVHVCEDGKYIFVPKRELGSNPDVPDESLPILNDYENIDDINNFLSTVGKKEAVRLQFTDLFNGGVKTIRLESRRLSQLIDFADLSKEEKLKDLIPVLVCYYVSKV